ncbi:MAG: serine hydrolase domain-containing protein [Gemmatimonadota bacterium]
MSNRRLGRRRLSIAVLLFQSILAGFVEAQQSSDRMARARASILRFLDSTGVASVAVAVAKDGKIVYEEGFGWANRERQIRADPNTMYSLASISKPFTATGLMRLVEAGKVDLEQPPNTYLGAGKLTGLAGDASGATVRRVLSHTAGLPLHYQFFYAGAGYQPPSMDETIARYGNLVFAPGTVYEYSNLGFGIIDYIISRVSGQSYADYMRTQVFLPLGLTHTSIDIASGLEPYAAERYDARQRPIPFYRFDHTGASAVYSSAHDLVRFGMFHLKDHLTDQVAILKDQTIDLMHQPVPPASYGLGFGVTEDDNGYRRFSHTGGMPGVATVMNLYPTENLVVVVLTNSSSRPGELAQDVAAAMLPRYADSLAARRARSRPPAPPAFSGAPELTGEWAGTLRTWKQTVPLRLQFKPDGDIFAWLGDQPRAVLNQVTFTGNRLNARLAGSIPTDDAGRWPHSLLVGLILVDGTLKGQIAAATTTDPNYFALSSYAELKKK